ncbi:MAG TPA: Ig-like domain-containing protein, partial [Candidatus Limnocylindrales bacterium]
HSDSNVATVSITVRPVNDNPECGAASVSPATLWSPDHKMVALEISGLTDVEGDAVTVTAVSVRQDEPVEAQADGNTGPDAILQPLQVRAERSGLGDGRVYHVEFRATDAHGGACTGRVLVCVPHDQSGHPSTCGDGGPLYDSNVR